MFVPRQQNLTKSSDGKPESSGRAPVEKTPPKSNTLWQSLALRTPPIQPKLSVSQPGDSYEREADHIADQVMRTEPQLQRACACGGSCRKCQNEQAGHEHLQAKHVQSNLSGQTAVSPIVQQATHSSGQALEPITRAFMEPRFGYDFSGVQVHDGGEAADGARAVRARAYTVGRDIVFGSGEYKPATVEGQRLLAHELAHVVQQSGEDSDLGIQREASATAQTERVAGTLWAQDATGKALPPSLDDISQGGVGDCALFASLATIVNTNPQKIVNMIKDNGNGTYTVTFAGLGFFSTAEQTVSAADFPVGKHGRVTARKALWPLIIEKAYAQEKGGTEDIEALYPEDVLDDLLNAEVSNFDPRDETADYIMGKVAKAKEEKWPMTIYSPKEGSSKKKALAGSITGLYFDHAYAIIDVDPIKKRIKLFNPWGHDHPNGDGWLDVEQVRTFFKEITING